MRRVLISNFDVITPALPETPGDAVAADIALGETAWVNGELITGTYEAPSPPADNQVILRLDDLWPVVVGYSTSVVGNVLHCEVTEVQVPAECWTERTTIPFRPALGDTVTLHGKALMSGEDAYQVQFYAGVSELDASFFVSAPADYADALGGVEQEFEASGVCSISPTSDFMVGFTTYDQSGNSLGRTVLVYDVFITNRGIPHDSLLPEVTEVLPGQEVVALRFFASAPPVQ